MSIFNSLGSNYTFGFALRAIAVRNRAEYKQQLTDFLEKRYGGKTILTYKGREALRLAIRAADLPKKYTIGICGFTCYAVYEAVVKEGYKARYIDIDDEGIHFSFEKLRMGIQKYPSVKLLIVQNTLGFPCEIEKIAKFCRDRKVILIEDLAHCVGARYSQGQEAGVMGDFTVLSFSQDKMVDGVSGGALVLRDKNFKSIRQAQDKLPISNPFDKLRTSFQFQKVNKGQQFKDRLYPLFTWVIRRTYEFGVGRVLHAILKKLDLLSKPMGQLQQNKIYGLTDWQCHLIYRQFMGLNKDLFHRKKIASIYADRLYKDILSDKLASQISNSTNLRFPIFVKKRQELISFLKDKKLFVGDIWYDSPIAPRRFLHLTDYNNECPNSEEASQSILNLPTHRNIGERDALLLVEEINSWYRKNSKNGEY